MAASSELRVPFHDHRLVEWCTGLPARVKLRGRSGKWLLRRAAHRRLPPECTAAGKRGFSVPVSKWLRHELHGPLRDALLASDSFARARFGEKPLARLLDDHRHGVSDRREELFALWILELWLRQHEVGYPGRAPEAGEGRKPAGGALKGRDIVCFSNDWDGDPLSKM